MEELFKEYNNKYFRNIQFIYEFFEKTGMTNSLTALKNESQVDHIKCYDNYFYDTFEHSYYVESDREDSEGEIKMYEQSDSDLGLDPVFLKTTVEEMNETLLCKAIDVYEDLLKNERNISPNKSEKNEMREKHKIKEKEKPCFTTIVHQQDQKIEDMNMFHEDMDRKQIVEPKIELFEATEKTDSYFEDKNIGTLVTKLKHCNLKKENEDNIVMEMETKISEGATSEENSIKKKKYSEQTCRYKLKKNAIKISKRNKQRENRTDKECEKSAEEEEEEEKEEEEKEEKEKEMNDEGKNCTEKEDEWENYFSCEKEICQKLHVKYIKFEQDKKKDESNSEDCNVLTVKYIDMYGRVFRNFKNSEFANVVFFRKYMPMLILTGDAKNFVKLYLTIYESCYNNQTISNDKESNEKHADIGCILISEMLECKNMDSPVMCIDINYEHNCWIASTMNGEIYFCKIDIDYLKELVKNIECIDDFEILSNEIKERIKKKKSNILEVLKIYKDHTKYSLKCEFNENYTLFASIANDKNLNIYEQMYEEISKSNFYEKVKTVGLPEVPTSFLWVSSSVEKESCHLEKEKKVTEKMKMIINKRRDNIVIGMLNSNHILFLNSANYLIEKKVDLFRSNEKYNILNLAYNKKKHIIVICTDTSQLFVYSLKTEKIIKILYGCVLNSLSFPSVQLNNNGDNVYVTSDDNINGTFILIFDIKSGNILNKINNGFKIRCFNIFNYFICSGDKEKILVNDVNKTKKGLLFLSSSDKKVHFYSS